MAVIADITDFKFAYEGYQYPLPPDWKYAIRQQDQIIWLYNALAYIGLHAATDSDLAQWANDLRSQLETLLSEQTTELETKITAMVESVAATLRSDFAKFTLEITEQYDELMKRLDDLEVGAVQWTSPVVGYRQYAGDIEKMLYDLMRPFTWSYGENDEWLNNLTYSEVEDGRFSNPYEVNEEYSYIQWDMMLMCVTTYYLPVDESIIMPWTKIYPFNATVYTSDNAATKTKLIRTYSDMTAFGVLTEEVID